jgi:hypothetical protein
MNEEMKNRVLQLLKQCLESVNDEYMPGNLSRADFDELGLLIARLSADLPTEFTAIFKESGFKFDGADQIVLADRLLRIIEVSEKYGEVPSPLNEPNLSPEFSLEADDKRRVAKLCADMRKIVFASTFFDDAHKVRLLDRIKAIETETLKAIGKVDTVLAGVVDVGDALGAFGKKVKPLTDRMREVAGLIKKGSKEYSQLPSPDEQLALPSPKEDESED